MTTDVPYTLGDYFDVVRRRWVYVAAVLPAAVLLALYLAYTLPPLYRSSGTILLEPSSIPEDMIRTTVTSYAGQHIELVQRQVMAVDNLVPLVARLDPYPNEELTDREKAFLIADNTEIERVDPITLEPLTDSTAFSMHYYNENPQIAVSIATELVEMFLSYNRESRARRAAENYDFLSAQAAEAREQIVALEERIAEFKTRYGEALPEAQARNLQASDRAERELDGFNQQIRLAEERKTLLELQLDQINPNLFDPAGDWRTELAALRTELAVARQRYSEDHPTVRRLTRSIEAMSARAEAEPAARRVVPDNPEYIQLASQVQAVTIELEALRSGAARARQQLANYERTVAIAPDVEREYLELTREYEIVQARFGEIQASLSEAGLAQTLESEQRGERFTLIRSPNTPSRPVSPNRLGILLLGIVLGGAVAVGLAALRESSDPTIRSARDLAEFTEIKPVGAIPFLTNPQDRQRRLFAWAAASLVLGLAVTFVGLTIAQA
jgi:polysaccharide biosynthesis transport protein